VRRRRIAASLLGAAVLVAGVSAAGAQEEEETENARVVLRAVDSRDEEAVKVLVSYSGSSGDLDNITITENGDEVSVDVTSAADAGLTQDLVFVVDSSTSTDANAMLTNVEEALTEFVQDLPPATRVAIITSGAASQVLQPFTVDPDLLVDGITDLTPGGEGGVLAGVVQAAGRIAASDNIGTVVLFTDGVRDDTVGADVAEGELDSAGAMLHVVALTTDALDQAGFESLAEGTGGTFRVTDDALQIGAQLDELRPELSQLAVATYSSSAEAGVQDLIVRVGDAGTNGSYIAGGNQIGADRLQARPSIEPSGPSFLRTSLGKSIGFAGVLVAGILFAFGLVSIFVRENTGLDRTLDIYARDYGGTQSDADEDSGLSQTAFLRRAVEASESFAERRGFLEALEGKLEKADLPLRAGEAMFFYAAVVVLVLGLTFALSSNILGALFIGLFAIIIPPSVLNFLAARKKKQFEGLLPDTLQLLSSTLRAGYSMMQGVEAVSQEAAEPMGKELRRVVTEARLGRPLEEALDGIAERMGSDDFGWAVMAIRIQREVGGNLSELLLTVADTMTQRERLRRDVRSLTAEGRMSAYVLGGLPIGLGFVLWTMNPEYIGRLFNHTFGQVMLGASVLSMLIGFAWMFKIIKIEI
jgi:tight adherence protein B